MPAAPCSNRRTDSTARVEKVVNPPQKPMAANGRTYRVGGHRSVTRVTRTPRRNEPATLTVNVAHGKPEAGTTTARATA